MNYRIVKLDGRHSWNSLYEYCLEFHRGGASTGVLDFDRSRKWMNSTWGWSQDVETQSAIKNTLVRTGVTNQEDLNPAWAYSVQYRNYRIYLRGQAELNWFVLANPVHEKN